MELQFRYRNQCAGDDLCRQGQAVCRGAGWFAPAGQYSWPASGNEGDIHLLDAGGVHAGVRRHDGRWRRPKGRRMTRERWMIAAVLLSAVWAANAIAQPAEDRQIAFG